MRMNLKPIRFLSIFTFLLLTACAAPSVDLTLVDTTNLTQLEAIEIHPLLPSNKRVVLGSLRIRSLKDTAMSIGAQGGLAWASEQINIRMEQDRKYLDSIFNFNGLM